MSQKNDCFIYAHLKRIQQSDIINLVKYSYIYYCAKKRFEIFTKRFKGGSLFAWIDLFGTEFFLHNYFGNHFLPHNYGH